MFELHPQLAADTYDLGHFKLCRLLLARDACYPWFILVPRIDDAIEICDLSTPQQIQLIQESSTLARWLKERFAADKLNIAALGNVVPQLHVHHVVRYEDDPAWPAPIWGAAPPGTYTDETLTSLLATLAHTRIPGFTAQPAPTVQE